MLQHICSGESVLFNLRLRIRMIRLSQRRDLSIHIYTKFLPQGVKLRRSVAQPNFFIFIAGKLQIDNQTMKYWILFVARSLINNGFIYLEVLRLMLRLILWSMWYFPQYSRISCRSQWKFYLDFVSSQILIIGILVFRSEYILQLLFSFHRFLKLKYWFIRIVNFP